MNLAEWPLPMVRLSCKTCGMEQEFPTPVVRVVHGDVEMSTIRHDLSDCSEPFGDCFAVYTDALLVQAIQEPDESKVIDPKLLPQAREWREKLGLVFA